MRNDKRECIRIKERLPEHAGGGVAGGCVPAACTEDTVNHAVQAFWNMFLDEVCNDLDRLGAFFRIEADLLHESFVQSCHEQLLAGSWTGIKWIGSFETA